MDQLLQIFEKNRIDFITDVNLSKFSYLKTGGFAKLLILPKTNDEVILTIKSLNNNNIKYKVIGATSNIMFLDDTTYSCLISTSELKGLELDPIGNEIISGSGEMLADLSRFSLQNSIIGFEGFEGIPGTIGGAVFMNAGAYGYEIKNVLKSIEFVDENGEYYTVNKENLGLRYRNSTLREGKINGIVTKCVFDAKPGCQIEIENKMELFHSKRHKYQEFLYPNLGSIYSGSIYRELGNKDLTFKVISILYFLFNYKLKLFRRESPLNRKWLNDIVIKRFNLKFEKQPFSNKTINCLVNRGQGTNEMIRYLKELDELTNHRIPIENEIISKF